MIEPTAYLIIALFSIGMAVAFLAADPRSPTSRPLAALFALQGLAFVLNLPAYRSFPAMAPTIWIRAFSIVEIGIIASAWEWILRIGRTELAKPGDDRPHSDVLLRVAQGLACVYGVVGAVFPDVRNEVWNVRWTPALLGRPALYAFALPFVLSLLLAGVRVLQLLRAQVDPAERLRLVALVVATPFMCAGLVLPHRWKPVSFAIALTIFLVGAIRYHVLQGQRGQFLARFLSPQLVRLVRERGLPSTLQRTRVELSAVACDLRGFTAFADTASPEETMKLLDAYYAAAGAAVEQFGGSISNVAGDGILVLVGAPIAHADHARRAVAMAFAIRDRMETILAGWRKLGLEIGLGVGMASGFVTVGVIGSAERLEFTAIGPAVNLAARLCARAEAGQILADARIAGALDTAAGGYRVEQLETVEVKGFARPVTVYKILSAANDAGPAQALA